MISTEQFTKLDRIEHKGHCPRIKKNQNERFVWNKNVIFCLLLTSM